MISRPVVDGIERDVAGQAKVVRLNVQEDVGRAVAGRYGLSAVPTFLVLKDGGLEARFVGFPDRDKIVGALLGG